MKLETDNGEGMAQKILEAFFVQLHQKDPLQKLVILHMYLHVYQLDLAKMAGMFKALNKIQKGMGGGREREREHAYSIFAALV